MGLIDKLKRDIVRHRQKAAVLAVLFTVMVVLSVRAVFQLQPRPVMAALPPAEAAAPAAADAAKTDLAGGVEAEERIRQSKELWRRLREVRGVDASVAFSFDSSVYPPDPAARRATPISPERIEPVAATPPTESAEAVQRAVAAAVREQARALGVKSTAVSGGRPLAIVNQQLLSVGDQINGFEITAIRSREVEFRKDGVTVAVKMPDDLRGQ
jgi:hypothetical protein